MTDAIRVRIAGVTAEVSLQVDDTAVADAVRREYGAFVMSVPATADMTFEAPTGVDHQLGAEGATAALRREVLAGIADVSRSRGHVQFGAHAIVDCRGAALIVLAADGTDVRHVLTGLDLDLEILLPGRWTSDLSGAIVHLPSSTGGFDDPLPREHEDARPGRVTGALVFSDTASADGVGDDGFDGVVALARHALVHGGLNERSPILRAIRTIAASTPGIRSVRASDVPRLRELVSGWLTGAGRAAWNAPAFALRGDAALESENLWFRGSAHDYLDRGEDVVLVRREHDGAMVDVIGPPASALWRHASGISRGDLVDLVVGQIASEEVDRRAVEAVFDDLCRSGALGREPVWAIGADVAWSSTPTQVIALSATSADPRPVSLQGSARAIWHEIVETPHISLTELVTRCAQRFDVDVDSIRSEVALLLQDLRRRELIGWV